MTVAGRIDPLLAAAGAHLRVKSRAIREAVRHRGEIGRGHESALRQVLEPLLPERLGLKTGSVLGASGTISRQIDLMLVDSANYPTFSYEAGDLVIPDALLGVINVKTALRPSEVPTFFREARQFKTLMAEAIGKPWTGFYAVIGFWLDGEPSRLVDQFHAGVFAKRQGSPEGVDLLGAIDRDPLCFDLIVLGHEGEPPAFLAHRAHVPGIAFNSCIADSPEPFVDIYKLLVGAVDPRLSRIIDLAAPLGIELPEDVSHDPAFRATFAGKSADMWLAPGMVGEFQMFYANTGTRAWVRATPTEARLVVAGPAGQPIPAREWRSRWPSPEVYAIQAQASIEPGFIAGFRFEVVVPDDAAAGDYRFYARPAISGVGALTPETRANAATVIPLPEWTERFGPEHG